MGLDDAKAVLGSGGILKCREVLKVLDDLKFVVRGSGGHKVVKHPGLPDWAGSNFNCGHRPGDDVRPVYVRRLLRIIDEHEDELRRFLEG